SGRSAVSDGAGLVRTGRRSCDRTVTRVSCRLAAGAVRFAVGTAAATTAAVCGAASVCGWVGTAGAGKVGCDAALGFEPRLGCGRPLECVDRGAPSTVRTSGSCDNASSQAVCKTESGKSWRHFGNGIGPDFGAEVRPGTDADFGDELRPISVDIGVELSG